MEMSQLIILSLSSLFLILAVVFLIVKKKRERGHMIKSLDMALFLIKMPKYEAHEGDKKQAGDQKAFIRSMEQFYANFLNLNKKRPFWEKLIYGDLIFALEIASKVGEETISFYVAVPKHFAPALEKYVTGVFSKAVVKKIPGDYTIFGGNRCNAGTYLKFKKPDIVSITTYEELEKDPLSQITNSLSKVGEGEGAAIQFIVKPTFNPGAKKRAEKIIEKMGEGKSLNDAIEDVSRSPIFIAIVAILQEIIKFFISKDDKNLETKEKSKNIDKKMIEGVERKIKKRSFDVNLRIIASAHSQQRANEILEQIENSFNQFSITLANGFDAKQIKEKKLRKLIYDYCFRNFNPEQKIVLNTEELSSVFHFPMISTETPHLEREKSLNVAPPDNLPKDGVLLLGKTVFREEEKKVYYATNSDRRRHLYVIGQTGTGKSAFLKGLIRQDIEKGRGVCIIDPHGDLIEDILAVIPQNRVNDVVLFDPADIERPMGLNMLEAKTIQEGDFAIQEMVTIFQKLFLADHLGPMFEHYMRHAMLTLMADKENPGTLVEISRLFTDDDYVKKYLEHVTDPLLRHFWYSEWFKISLKERQDMTGYLVSKLGRFVENEMMRNIVGQSHSGFNIENIINNEKILLVNLSKGLVGEVNSSLLGLILVSKIQMAAMKRANIPENERKDFYLYIDEFQNFTTNSIATILSEARKYKLNMILAHQYIKQLTDEIRNSVIGNVGSRISFRVGNDDVEILEQQFSPEFSKFDLLHIDNFKAITKIMINDKTSSPFVLNTLPPLPLPENYQEVVKEIKKVSKLKYARPKLLVEREIMRRMDID